MNPVCVILPNGTWYPKYLKFTISIKIYTGVFLTHKKKGVHSVLQT